MRLSDKQLMEQICNITNDIHLTQKEANIKFNDLLKSQGYVRLAEDQSVPVYGLIRATAYQANSLPGPPRGYLKAQQDMLNVGFKKVESENERD